ncbi:MAG: hypothetical protein LBV62_02325 [Rickettsiales bacterium]|jgi:hypothetical protein|nr:hypothetical protein [Rickettsiales bacterium]
MKNFALILLLVLFPFFASSINIERDCDYEYYPKLDHNSADELYAIKQNYYRYGEKLKVLADERIKEIKEATLKTDDR